jgi:hypothetical protein
LFKAECYLEGDDGAHAVAEQRQRTIEPLRQGFSNRVGEATNISDT